MRSPLLHPDRFIDRHIGPDETEMQDMLRTLEGPIARRVDRPDRPEADPNVEAAGISVGRNEHSSSRISKKMASANEVFRSFIGMGYYDCITPP